MLKIYTLLAKTVFHRFFFVVFEMLLPSLFVVFIKPYFENIEKTIKKL